MHQTHSRTDNAAESTSTPRESPNGGLAGNMFGRVLRVLLCACALAFAAADLVVSTVNGPVRGSVLTVGSPPLSVAEFLGIPFAAAPKGALRFAAPVPPAPWTVVRNATQYGYACLQRDSSGLYGAQDEGTMSKLLVV